MDEVWELEALAKAYKQELEADPEDFGLKLNIHSLRRRAAKILTQREADSAPAAAATAALRVAENRLRKVSPSDDRIDESAPQPLWRAHAH